MKIKFKHVQMTKNERDKFGLKWCEWKNSKVVLKLKGDKKQVDRIASIIRKQIDNIKLNKEI